MNALRETQLTLPQNVDQFYPELLATVMQNYFHVADATDILTSTPSNESADCIFGVVRRHSQMFTGGSVRFQSIYTFH